MFRWVLGGGGPATWRGSSCSAWLVATVAGLFLGMSGRVSATPFVNEFIETGAATVLGYYNSIAIDPQGNTHIAYFNDATDDLRYARKVGASWVLENVDGVGNYGEFCSLAVDVNGIPHVSYYDGNLFDLKYATKVGNVWVVETVDAAGVTGYYTSIALDDANQPHISYYDNTNLDLRYARKSGGVWIVQTVASTGNIGQYTSLKLDHSGFASVSYYDLTNSSLVYSRRNSVGWTSETVESAGDVGARNSLALDAADSPRIAYTDATNGDLKYAVRTGTGWTLEVVDSAGIVGSWPSLALDATGNPRVSYHDSSNGDLKFASRSATTWTVETVDLGIVGSVGTHTSLALDRQGNPRIAYHDGFATDPKYADSSVRVISPGGGTVWPVGAVRSVSWAGVGPVEVYISPDAGTTFLRVLSNISENVVSFRVPHVPTKFASIEVRRFSPLSYASSDSVFTIEASIALLGLTADAGASGNVLQWSTSPGPEDLAGYKVERRGAAAAPDWQTLVSSTRETTFEDGAGKRGDQYRLTAINGLGEEYALGEVSVGTASPLTAWPLPYRGGTLNISFATAGGVLGSLSPGEVAVYDLAGRLVRRVAQGAYGDGIQSAVWDGRDEAGADVSAGIYFVRATTHGLTSQVKVAVVR